MFGLENQKKKKSQEFIFELEKELKTTKRHQEIKANVENKIQKIKESLRGGENRDEYDSLGVLLYGYSALVKVMSRFSPK